MAKSTIYTRTIASIRRLEKEHQRLLSWKTTAEGHANHITSLELQLRQAYIRMNRMEAMLNPTDENEQDRLNFELAELTHINPCIERIK